MIGVIDYGMGNIASVVNAFNAIGERVKIIKTPQELDLVESIVLPGVGSFGDGIKNLRNNNMADHLYDHVLIKNKKFLGICLGMQLIAEKGYEYGEHIGLGWIQGEVKKIAVPEGQLLRIPHVGWNNVHIINGKGLYNGFPGEKDFYFVHSFAFVPKDLSLVSGTVTYGASIVASIEINNISATQFHPEKSHQSGLLVLRNWCKGQ